MLEHVEDGVSGLLVHADDEEAWASAVERLEDDAESERLGAGAYESWCTRFSPEIGLASLEAIYEEAIEHAEDR